MAHESKLLNVSDVNKRMKDLETLLDLSKALTVQRDFDQLLDLIIRETVRVMEADRGTLFIVDESNGDLVSKIAQKAEVSEIRVPVGKGIAGHVAATREVVNIQDAYSDSRFNQAVDRQTGYRTKTILCAPLLTHEDKVIGVVQVLNKRDGIFSKYDESLLMALGSHAAVALDNARLVRHYLEKQVLMQSLQIAQSIQRRLLPRDFPVVAGYEVRGWTQAADETGGDYFDTLLLSTGEVVVVIGDVSGHGVGPALIMATTRAFLRSLCQTYRDPAEILFRLNNLLVQDVESGSFVTLFLGILTPATGAFVYTSAGHDPPLLYQQATGQFLELDSTGLPLGLIQDADFPAAHSPPLCPGDLILFTTDGVWEAMNAANEAYGRERLKERILADRGRSATELLQAIYDEVKAFCGPVPQRDDITMLVVKSNGR